MPNENRKALMLLRLEQAAECLKASEIMLNAAMYKSAANRSYYCIFHAMRAVLAQDAFDSKKHSDVISAFREKYIKTKIFPIFFSDIIKQAFSNRGQSDYNDFFIISKEETVEQVENAKAFLAAIEAYIKNLHNNTGTPDNNANVVSAIQHRLNILGITGSNGRPLAIDGSFGPQTQSALGAFQAAYMAAGSYSSGVAGHPGIQMQEGIIFI